MKNVIDVLLARGFIEQMTHEELRDKVNQPIKAYIGFDPTADSLHLGNLVGVMGLAWFYRYGHKPVALVGGATGLIGDPSGKSVERNLLDETALQHNVRSLTAFFKRVMPEIEVVNNFDWFGKFTWIDFLRDVGKNFRIGQMIGKEMVRNRLQSDEGLSFTEFCYQIMQAYDFCYLNQKHGVSLQMGGSDQWGNITAGTELNRKLGGDTLYGLTFSLLTKSDGTKFGKSESGAIWLNSDKLSPYQFYQHLVRVADADVIKLLKMLTFLDLEEIAEIEKGMDVPNIAQKRLAAEVTRFVHGEDGLQAALAATETMAPGREAELSVEGLEALGNEVPNVELAIDEVVGQKFVDIAAKSGLVTSKSEATKLIKNNGAYLNNVRVADIAAVIQKSDLIGGLYVLLSAGKKKRLLIKIDLKNNR